MTTSTTLIDELLEAADVLTFAGTNVDGEGNDDASYMALAARLRARAAVVRDWEEHLAAGSMPSRYELWGALIGPIPTPGEPS
jgi:uncharacterized protein YciI